MVELEKEIILNWTQNFQTTNMNENKLGTFNEITHIFFSEECIYILIFLTEKYVSLILFMRKIFTYIWTYL